MDHIYRSSGQSRFSFSENGKRSRRFGLKDKLNNLCSQVILGFFSPPLAIISHPVIPGIGLN